MLFYFGRSEMFPLIGDATVGMLLCGLLSMLMIPAPTSIDIRGWSEMNANNGNAWTHCFEYFANLLYTLVIYRFSKMLLDIFVNVPYLKSDAQS